MSNDFFDTHDIHSGYVLGYSIFVSLLLLLLETEVPLHLAGINVLDKRQKRIFSGEKCSFLSFSGKSFFIN